MSKKIPPKLALAALVAMMITDIQLYIMRFHPPTEMLGRYLRKHVIPDWSAEPAGVNSDPGARFRFDAPSHKV